MFHTILTLSYTIPAIYLFIRIWQLFIEKQYRILYLVLFGILFSIYPVANLFEDSDTGIFMKIVGTVSGYLLPFFLYLFLEVLITDLFLLINLGIKVIPEEMIRKRGLRNRVFIFMISFSATIVVAGTINFNTVRTSDYSIAVPGGSSDIKKLRIAFLSDFHLEEKTGVRFVKRFVKKIESVDPDIVLFGGDIVEGGRIGSHMQSFEEILKSMKPQYGVFGVLGNHDGYSRGNVESFLENSGIVILKDTIVVPGGSFVIAGRKDSRVSTRKSAADLVNLAPSNLPVILLDHRPTEIDQISRSGADIAMFGHTHHGQLFPINFITRSVYELSYGYLKKGKTNFFVSSGIRLWGPPVRTVGKSEIMVVDVVFE